MSQANFIVSQSEILPIMTATSTIFFPSLLQYTHILTSEFSNVKQKSNINYRYSNNVRVYFFEQKNKSNKKYFLLLLFSLLFFECLFNNCFILFDSIKNQIQDNSCNTAHNNSVTSEHLNCFRKLSK